jgi:hypothetical protein
MTTRLERISASEAASRKNCTRQNVNNAIRSGKLNAEKIGSYNAVVVDKDFEKWEPNRKIQKAQKARWGTAE